MNSYRRFFGIVLSMALLAASGCAEDRSAVGADDEPDSITLTTTDQLTDDDKPPLFWTDSYTPTQIRRAQALQAQLLAMREQERLPFLKSLLQRPANGNLTAAREVNVGACIGGAIVIVANTGSCLAGNVFSCVSAFGGLVAFTANCNPTDPVDRPSNPWDHDCVGNRWC